MNALFDINDLKKTKVNQIDKSFHSDYFKLHQFKIDSLKSLISLPKNNDLFFLWTYSSFNAFTIVPFLLQSYNCITDLIITSYSLNIRILDAIFKLIDNKKILNITFFLSDSMHTRIPKVVDHLNYYSDLHNNIKIIYSWNHSKIALLHCNNDYFIFEGSGNFSENTQFEQYVFLNSKNIYEFRRNCILTSFNSK